MSSALTVLDGSVVDDIRSAVVVPSVSQCLLELVHNSLDSGARHVSIDFSPSSSQLTVTDDGVGIPWSDLQYLGSRYATSKFSSMADLDDSIMTFGYRGEALASVCKLARVSICSRSRYSMVAYEKVVEFGRVVSALDSVTHPSKSGTVVDVSQLFQTLPVRQRAYSPSRELAGIRQMVEVLAIACPRISFTIKDRDTCTRPETLCFSTSLEGFASIYLKAPVECYHAIYASSDSTSDVHVSGFIIENAAFGKQLQIVLVNKRSVKSMEIHSRIASKFRNDEGRHVAFFVDITLPYTDIDIHLEPSKATVLFRDLAKVLAAVENAFKLSPDEKVPTSQALQLQPQKKSDQIKGFKRMKVSKHANDITPTSHRSPFVLPPKHVKSTLSREECLNSAPVKLTNENLSCSQLTVIGQVDNKFIVCSLPKDNRKLVILIDQHAADERVQLEKRWLQSCIRGEGREVLKMVPLSQKVPLHLNHRETGLIRTHAELFNQWGIGLCFDSSVAFVTALPDFAATRAEKDGDWVCELVMKYLAVIVDTQGIGLIVSRQKLESARTGCPKSALRLFAQCPESLVDLIKSNACRSAIMFGDTLTRKECIELINKLTKCQLPFQCAHGRPSAIPILIL